LRAGIVLSTTEARKIAEALVTIQQVAGRVGIHLIDKLDVMEGDPDLETERLEDDFTPMPAGIDYGPGCPVADVPEDHDHGGGDVNDEPHDGDEGIWGLLC
jgi:hypothetical protein